MYPVKQIAPNVSVSGSLQPEDIATMAGQGFRGLINNRPDGEEEGQATNAALEAAAKALGLEYRFIPITGAGLTAEIVAAYGEALKTLPGPILAFCRSGARSTNAWKAATGN